MKSAILVVEDEPITQKLIVANLERAGYEVVRASSVPEAKVAIREVLPILVLLDWVLPDVTGVSFIRQLRTDQRTCDVPIIMLTSRTNDTDKIAGLEAGADDYITKPFSPGELLARVKAVIRRRAPLHSDQAVEIAGLRLDPAAHRITAGTRKIELGATEFRLLHFFMSHPERVYSRGQLLDEVWGDHVFVDDRTVDVHIRRIRQALHPSGHHELIETLRGIGYRFLRAPADSGANAEAEAAAPVAPAATAEGTESAVSAL
ncbi:MAG TPA: phosphate regulon transcriptional regulator PhoB [Burkholderiales bacterium]|nr:phosphate regulon transcriptional regulator PhoB [Burkholderiales bacterium]